LVVGFERFFAEGDPSEYLATGGLLLVNELNCVACHQPPEAWAGQLSGRKGTDLSEAGGRLKFEDLWLAIRHPASLRRGARMPSLFAHPDRNEEDIDALASFLLGLRSPIADAEVDAVGDPQTGQALFHSVGCVACHAPELAEGWEKPNVPSSALTKAERYSPSALAMALRKPGSLHAGERNPDFGLSEDEAAHIAAYLRGDQDSGRSPMELALVSGSYDPSLSDKGRALFSERGCASCHTGAEVDTAKPMPMAAPLIELRAMDQGCLAEEAVQGDVHWGLSELQTQAIGHALERIRQDPQSETVQADEAMDFQLMSRDCFACHSWREKGGLEEARQAFWPEREVTSLDGSTDPLDRPCRLRMTPAVTLE